MRSNLIAQPFDGPSNRIGDHLVRLLGTTPRFDILRIGVAYAKTSGVLRLADALTSFQASGGRVQCVVGIEDGVTSVQALRLLLDIGVDTSVFHNPVTTFHPKVYLFTRAAGVNREAVAIVGSGNLTAGGLFTNYEAATLSLLDLALAEDRRHYARLRRLFGQVTSSVSGTCRQLTTVLLEDLASAGSLADESHLTRTTRGLPTRSASGLGLFERAPVPPAPRVPPHWRHRIPPRQFASPAESVEPEIVAEEGATFVMVMGPRDVGGNRAGFSPDVFVPLAARDSNPDFWNWPSGFVSHETETTQFLERRTNLLIQGARTSSAIAEDVRFYFYPNRSEFRINSSDLVRGATVADLLVLRRPEQSGEFGGSTYEYEAVIVPANHPSYQALLSRCINDVPKSRKKWGYFSE